MRKLAISFVIAILAAMTVNAQNKLTIESITKGEFSLRYPASVTPLTGGDSYARLNPDRNRIEEYSYKNGQLLRCLFDAGEVRKYLRQEQWVIDIAKKDHIQWSDIEDVVENFIILYWLLDRKEITSQHVGEILRIAKDFQP